MIKFQDIAYCTDNTRKRSGVSLILIRVVHRCSIGCHDSQTVQCGLHNRKYCIPNVNRAGGFVPTKVVSPFTVLRLVNFKWCVFSSIQVHWKLLLWRHKWRLYYIWRQFGQTYPGIELFECPRSQTCVIFAACDTFW